MGNMDIKDEASIINSDENVVSDVEQADLSINGDEFIYHIIRMPK